MFIVDSLRFRGDIARTKLFIKMADFIRKTRHRQLFCKRQITSAALNGADPSAGIHPDLSLSFFVSDLSIPGRPLRVHPYPHHPPALPMSQKHPLHARDVPDKVYRRAKQQPCLSATKRKYLYFTHLRINPDSNS
jgi:hypothetical protein